MSDEQQSSIVTTLESEEELIRTLCEFVTSKINEALEQSDFASIGLSGGSVATFLARGLISKKIDWNKVHLFFCDERFVPYDDKDSTYKVYAEGLFSKVSIPAANIHKIEDFSSVEAAAAEYELQMKKVFGASGLPRFDILLLGMGPDGHTCSLFPNHPLLEEKSKWVASISDSPKPPPARITMTLPVVNNCRSAVFACVGTGKADMATKIISAGDHADPSLPSTCVQPKNGKVHWFLDTGAASKL